MRVLATAALAALITAIVAAGCGEENDSVVVTVTAPATAPEPAATPAPEGKASSKKDPRATKPNGKSQAAGPEVEVADCPDGVSERECDRLAHAVQDAGPSRVLESGECPAGMSKRDCRELAKAAAQAGGGHVVKPGQCRPPLTKADCEALARARADGGGG